MSSETYLARDVVEYSIDSSNGVLDRLFNIALEHQVSDPVIFEEGLSGSGLFYLTDPKNNTGTYKRLTYHQIMRAFYNNSKNPMEVFGLENIDFQTSLIQKYPSNHFRIFSLPQEKFGDKIVEGSVTFVDNTFDDNYVVTDDGHGNLLAAPNLFSKSQEVGSFTNTILTGSISHGCPSVISAVPLGSIPLTASALSYSASYLNWTYDLTDANGFYIWRSDNSGSTWFYIGSTVAAVTHSYDHTLEKTSSYSYKVAAYNILGNSSYSNTASITTTGPASIPGLVAWYAADDFEGILNDGDLVGGTGVEWPDKTGNGYNGVQDTAALKPIFNTNVFGTKPALTFKFQSGYVFQSFLDVTNGLGYGASINLPGAYTIFVVWKTQNDVGTINFGGGCLIGDGHHPSAAGTCVYGHNSIPGGVYGPGTLGNYGPQPATSPGYGDHYRDVAEIAAWGRSDAGIDFYRVNDLAIIGDNAINAQVLTLIGANNNSGANRLSAKVGEICIWNVALTETEQSMIAHYFASKYGMTI